MRRITIMVSFAVVLLATLTVGASSALAQSPWWHLSVSSGPAHLPPAEEDEEGKVINGKGQVVLTAANLGDAPAHGAKIPIHIADKLPEGLKATSISAYAETEGSGGTSTPVPCKKEGTAPNESLSCSFEGSLPAYGLIEVHIAVEVLPGASPGAPDQGSISGGQAASASISHSLQISGELTPFGVEDYEMTPEEEGGAADTQAGSHPFQLTTTLALNQNEKEAPVALPKDLTFNLPPGLIGNPTPFPQCTLGQFLTVTTTVGTTPTTLPNNLCSPKTAVGVAMPTVNEPNGIFGKPLGTFAAPVFNLEPSVGEPARFGFLAFSTPVFIDTSVRSGSDYGVTVSVHNISQTAAFTKSEVIFWGVPGDSRHDSTRGWGCLEEARELTLHTPCNASEEAHPPPLLSLPTSCNGPLHSTVEGDSWAAPLSVLSFQSQPMVAMDGCNQLPFAPQIQLTPDGTAASTPTGLNVDVHVPQDGQLNPTGLANSNIKSIAVTLPEGVTLNPAAADGLQACSESQVGFEGTKELETGIQTMLFSPTLPQDGLSFCPDAAKVATVKIKSPLLPAGQPLEGAVYLATPAPFEEHRNNPFNSTVAMYLVARDPASGTLVKLPGSVTLDQQTGRISSTFENTPQLAFEDAEIHFFGGERAPLATPDRCGVYTTEATFTPWSGNAPVHSTSSFEVKTGPNGTPCPSPLPFNPSLSAGSPNINAGSFSPLTTTISRSDGNQNIQTVQLHMAPGMSGILAGVPLCPEAQANAGTCDAASLIGETIVSVGLGGDPFTVTGGKVYLTEKYQGAPFGLSIVNPADAGPFHLGTVVVRAKIEVDPRTAQLTITTGEIPHILKGFPLQIKHVNVLINRPGFTVNPTNCAPMAITGNIGSVAGGTSPVSDPFQVTNCAALKFTPHLAVTTAGKASKANGASLFFNVTYPKGSIGSQSWFNEVKFTFPKQLPARLTTIQKACLAATFESNRGACPPASIIGHAVVHTPVLPVPLEGSVYFVSYGGAKFPDAVLVLDGYGVHIELHGETLIKNGVTSATFRNTPDVPFQSLEVNIPSGPFSEFGTNLPHEGHNFCGQKLVVPTFFKASNGAEIHQNTPVGVSGCSTKASIASRNVKGRNITLTVYAPAAGKLQAGGKGLSSSSKSAAGTEFTTLTLHTKRAGKSKRHVQVVFTPAHGRKQTLRITLRA
jgi:hypothetical protein